MSIQFSIASESSLMVYFGSTIDPTISKEVQKAYKALKEARYEGFFELIPSYASLMVQYDVLRYSYKNACDIVLTCIKNAKSLEEHVQKRISIPVYYGLEVGLDLELLSQEKNLSTDEIIRLHVKNTYSVYAIGFAPGFAYMGEIDAALATSRLPSPRKTLPKGSVSIADRQTAIYPMQSPGGWKILGRTPLAMFDEAYEGLSLLHVGDSVTFEPISKAEFLQRGGVL